MSHHLVTVCMFCLLCASHTTCNTHETQKHDVTQPQTNLQALTHHRLDDLRREEKSERYYHKLEKIRGHRRKRHAVEPETNPGYVEQLFKLYGDGDSMTMNLTGFNKMLEGLNLHKLTEGGELKIESKDYLYRSKEKDAEKNSVVKVSR